MIVVADPGWVEPDLAAGRLACPGCGGRLRPWGHAAVRRVRLLNGSTRAVRPRRVRCAPCGATHVLLPSWLLPRRGDAIEVIGAALVAATRGHGYRRIAADLDRPAVTVRRWIRAATRGRHLEWLRVEAVRAAVAMDAEAVVHLAPQPTPLGDTLAAFGAAVAAWRRRFGSQADVRRPAAWTLVGVFSQGRLLAPS